MDKAQKLDKVNKKWMKNCTCELKKTAINAVPGDGNPDADILFIGEAPGKKEDLEGKPFIGSAGKFLSTMLESIKLDRNDVYITSIVKYRPPNNRDPKPEEIDSCLPWLIDQIKVIEPKLVIFLGRYSFNVFFPGEKISDARGKLLKQNHPKLGELNFLPLYHPAAALYNGGMRKKLLDDFKLIPKYLSKIKRRP